MERSGCEGDVTIKHDHTQTYLLDNHLDVLASAELHDATGLRELFRIFDAARAQNFAKYRKLPSKEGGRYTVHAAEWKN